MDWGGSTGSDSGSLGAESYSVMVVSVAVGDGEERRGNKWVAGGHGREVES